MRLKEAIIVEGRYDKIKLSGFIESTIIETGGFRIFKDKDKQELIKILAAKNGLLIFTDSDSAGFVIRNFLKGIVPLSTIKNAYIPPIKGKEKRKAKCSKEGILGVEGITEDIIINSIKNSGATIINMSSDSEKSNSITKTDLFCLGLTGLDNSCDLRKKLLRKLNMPEYLSTNALVDVLNIIYSLEELKMLVEELD